MDECKFTKKGISRRGEEGFEKKVT